MISIKEPRINQCRTRLLILGVWLFAVGKLTTGCGAWGGEKRNILEPLTWVDTTKALLLQVSQHLRTQLGFSFRLAEDLWVGNGTV